MDKNIPLERQLLFTEKQDIEEYLQGNELNQELYKTFLESKDRGFKWKWTAEETFNEVFFQCAKIYSEKNPEKCVEKMFYEVIDSNLGTKNAHHLIIQMIWAILHSQKSLPDNVNYFYSAINPFVESNETYHLPFLSLVVDFWEHFGQMESDLYPNPVLAANLNIKTVETTIGFTTSPEWHRVTDGFKEQSIRNIVRWYRIKQDKLDVLELIETALSEWKQLEKEMSVKFPIKTDTAFFESLREEIRNSEEQTYKPDTLIDATKIRLEEASKKIEVLEERIEELERENANLHDIEYENQELVSENDKLTRRNKNLSRSMMVKERKKRANETDDIEECRQNIRIYIAKVHKFVNDIEVWLRIWNDIILDDRLSDVILAVGKQKETTFNRSLVANIIHLLGVEKKMMRFYNASELAKKLEGSVNHSVRASLGLNPSDKEIVEVVNEIFSRVCARN